MPFTHIHGARIEVERIAGSGPTTLVFLHEGLGSASLWRGFPRALAEAVGCPALVYSRRGYGQSDPAPRPWPTTFMHREAHGPLPELLKREGIEDLILVGHSDGASIALIYAGEAGYRGARLRGLILEAPHVFVEEVCVASVERIRQDYATGDLRQKLARHHADVDGAFHGWADVWGSTAFRPWDITSVLPTIQAPLMVIQGEDDPYGTLAQVDAVARGVTVPVERVILPRCEHTPHREQAEATLAAMRGFVLQLIEGDEGGRASK